MLITNNVTPVVYIEKIPF